MENVYVRDLVREKIGQITHREGNDSLFRVINMLAAYGLTNLTAAAALPTCEDG